MNLLTQLINMNAIVETCKNPNILRIIYFVKQLLNLIYFAVPIGLILMVMLDFSKNVIAKDSDAMRKNVSLAIKRIMFAIVMFLVYTLVSFTMSLLEDSGIKSDWLTCYQNASLEKIKNFQTDYDNAKEEENFDDVETPDWSNSIIYNPVDNNTDNDTSNDGNSSNNNDTNSDNNSSDHNDTNSENRTNIFIGDSRCIGIQNALDSVERAKSQWICKTSEGYKWLTETAISVLDKKIKSDKKYNIIINLGVNDLYNTSKYFNYFNTLTKDEKYKNCKFIIVSVNPINDELAKQNNYTIKNSSVVTFNNKLKTELISNITYCNVYDKIKDKFKTTDGIHYMPDTSELIYNEIIKCL